jgi:formylglycine-generating enzyme required for sulfatase activity
VRVRHGLVFCVLAFSTTSALIVCAEEPALDALLKRFVSEFVAITPGKEPYPAKFTRGDIRGPQEERPPLEITALGPFSINKYEMPQNLYEAVMGENPSKWKGPRNSVEMMTWQEANNCCRKLTKLLQERELIAKDQEIRLPTETEWEYACRAGTKTRYSFGDELRRENDPPRKNSILDEYAWYTGNAAGNDPPVGALKPNAWGLYDMHGYLWEFTADAWTADYKGVKADSRPPKDEKTMIVLRSGSWKDKADRLTSAARQEFSQTGRDDAVGFRCVLAKKP